MTTQFPPSQSPAQRDDAKKQEMRREELEKSLLEQELADFDAYSFYDRLSAWSSKPIPKALHRPVHTSPFRVKQVMWQPIPLSRGDEREFLALSTTTGKVLVLLRKLDQKGLECPYVHQINKAILDNALDKCDHLKDASERYLQSKGFFAKVSLFFNRRHIVDALRDLEVFKRRLESLVVMCRHQEFAQDLVRLKREATYRTGNILRDDALPAAASAGKKAVRKAIAEERVSVRSMPRESGSFFKTGAADAVDRSAPVPRKTEPKIAPDPREPIISNK